jgi:phosphatidate phosphatase
MDVIHWSRLTHDIIIMLVLCAFLAYIKLIAKPFQSGFYCNDYSVNMPFKDSTVSNFKLIMLSIPFPLLVIVISELVCSSSHSSSLRHGIDSSSSRFNYRVITFSQRTIEIAEPIGRIYVNFGTYMFGLVSTYLLTHLGKKTIGRLRPNFLSVCKPDKNPYQRPCNEDTYLEPGVDFMCSSPEHKVNESRLSFPSGHASSIVYAMLFLILFINKTWSKHGKYTLLSHFVQLIFFVIAAFTSMSRVIDNKHHSSDVLAGAALGAFVAMLTFFHLTMTRRCNLKHRQGSVILHRLEENSGIVGNISNNNSSTSLLERQANIENDEGLNRITIIPMTTPAMSTSTQQESVRTNLEINTNKNNSNRSNSLLTVKSSKNLNGVVNMEDSRTRLKGV